MTKNIQHISTGVLIVMSAITIGFVIACFLITAYCTDYLIGSPSSTSSLILVYIPFYSGIGAMGGVVVGLLLKFLLDLFKVQNVSVVRLISVWTGTSLSLVVLAIFFGYGVVRYKSELMSPHVIYSDKSISKNSTTNIPVDFNSVIVPFQLRKQGKAIMWNDRDIILKYPSGPIHIEQVNGDLISHASLKQFDYIRQLQAREVELSPHNKRYLAVLADLRATSNRAILLVYSPEGELIYQEIIDNHGHEPIMGVHQVAFNKESLILKIGKEAFAYERKPDRGAGMETVSDEVKE